MVPPQGLNAWSGPDPNAAPVDTLVPGLDVQVVQRYGGWAQVACSNGWMCWVDGESLQPIGAVATSAPGYPAAAPPAPYGGIAARSNTPRVVAPLASVAGALVVLSAFLPWLSISGVDSNAFEVPIDFLWSIDATTEGSQVNSVGGLVVVVGFVIAALGLVRTRNGRRIAGGVAGLLFADYAVELFRLLNDNPGTPGFFSVLGFGVYIGIVGAALAFLDLGAST